MSLPSIHLTSPFETWKSESKKIKGACVENCIVALAKNTHTYIYDVCVCTNMYECNLISVATLILQSSSGV